MSPLNPHQFHLLFLKDVKRILWTYINSWVKIHVSCLSDTLTTQVTKMEGLKAHLGNCEASVTASLPGGREKEGGYSQS